MNLRLGDSLQSIRSTLHNGPGWRVAIWVQGCVHRCTTQCLNPHFLDPKQGTEYPVETVAAAMQDAARSGIAPAEGVTILGGEPFEQPAALAELLALLRPAGLSAMVYSGHTHEALMAMRRPDVDALLRQTDILADGPFVAELYDERLAWRGSSNQRLLCLTDRYTPAQLDAAFARQGKGFSFQIGGGQFSISGLQTPAGVRQVIQALVVQPAAAQRSTLKLGESTQS